MEKLSDIWSWADTNLKQCKYNCGTLESLHADAVGAIIYRLSGGRAVTPERLKYLSLELYTQYSKYCFDFMDRLIPWLKEHQPDIVITNKHVSIALLNDKYDWSFKQFAEMAKTLNL